MQQTKRALLSVSDKKNILPFVEKLKELQYQFFASDGTLKFLSQQNIDANPIQSITHTKEMMDGRVKTLHPNIYGGILMRRNNEKDKADAQKNNIFPIDIVVVNLYPFEEKLAAPSSSHEELLEQIDIGGVSLLRAAAKNYRWVLVLTDQRDYPAAIKMLQNNEDDQMFRLKLAQKAFEHTFHYDLAIANYFKKKSNQSPSFYFSLEVEQKLRYGENPHEIGYLGSTEPLLKQPAEKTSDSFLPSNPFPSLNEQSLLSGKSMSYNNYLDSYEACRIANDFDGATCVVVKHANPCGLAENLEQDIATSVKLALEGDVVSAYGSIIALNRKLTLDCAKALKSIFVEIIIAPDYEEEALLHLKKKSSRLRILSVKELSEKITTEKTTEWRMIGSKVLIKETPKSDKIIEVWEPVTDQKPDEKEKNLYLFTFRAVKHIKSNAIAIAYLGPNNTHQLISIGAGQPNRIDSIVKLALTKAEENFKRLHPNQDIRDLFSRCVLASDAFFPFADSISLAAEAGIKKFIQPGGSIRDDEVISEANKNNACLIFTKMRHFKH